MIQIPCPQPQGHRPTDGTGHERQGKRLQILNQERDSESSNLEFDSKSSTLEFDSESSTLELDSEFSTLEFGPWTPTYPQKGRNMESDCILEGTGSIGTSLSSATVPMLASSPFQL